jgi:hypothetical protein
MYINWSILIIVALIILALLSFLLISNRRDRKGLEDQLNNDYPKGLIVKKKTLKILRELSKFIIPG